MERGDFLCPKGTVEGLLGLPVLQHILKVGDVLREGECVCVFISIWVGAVEKG